MLSDFQPSGHSRIFSLEGSAGEAKAEAKRQRRGKVETDMRHGKERKQKAPEQLWSHKGPFLTLSICREQP